MFVTSHPTKLLLHTYVYYSHCYRGLSHYYHRSNLSILFKKEKAAAAIEEEDIQFINPYQDQQWAEVTPQPGTSKPAGATTASAGKPVTGRPATNRPATNKPVTDNPVTDRLVMATGGPAAAPAAASAHPTEPYTTVTTQNTASQTMSAIENLRQRNTYTHKDLENSL